MQNKYVLFFCFIFLFQIPIFSQISAEAMVLKMNRGINLGNVLSAPIEGNWQDAVIQMVANILFQHRVQLRSAFRMFDMENTGEISGDEFRAAVMVINPLLPQSISELQISSLRRALEHPETGQIHYKEFLEAFEIVDVGYVGRNGSQGFYK